MSSPSKLKKTPFLQFRAGKMKFSNGIVSPDLRKGCLSFMKQPLDTVEVTWTGSGSDVEDVLIWRKNQVSVSFVEKCTTGRVLLFKVTDNGREKLHFFWLQDKSDAKDAEYLAQLKEAFPGKPTATESATPSIQLEDLKKILASISGGSTANEVSLSALVSSSKVTDAVKSDIAFYEARLKDTLPSELASSGNIVEQIKNPQVTRAAATLEAGLSDPETCKELCTMYGLPESTVGVSGFLNAIINQAKKSAEK